MSDLNTPPLQPPSAASVTADVPSWAIRLEAKVDVALTQHAARLDLHASDIADHEQRLREVEQRRTVSPTGLWAAVIGGISAFAALVGIVQNIIPN